QRHGGENSDDQNDDQQLDQGEPSLAVAPEEVDLRVHHHCCGPPDGAHVSSTRTTPARPSPPASARVPVYANHGRVRAGRSGISPPASLHQPEQQLFYPVML